MPTNRLAALGFWVRKNWLPIGLGILAALAAATSLLYQLSSYQATPTASPPTYPWPPPKANASLVTSPRWFNGVWRSAPYSRQSVGAAYWYIRNTIYSGGFRRVGAYAIASGGFCLITEPERILSN